MRAALTSDLIQRLSLNQLRQAEGFLTTLTKGLDDCRLLYIEIGQADAWSFEMHQVRDQLAECRKRRRDLTDEVRGYEHGG